MNEEPKNIWKKSFTGRMALVIWLAVATVAVIVGSYIAALANFSYPMRNWVENAGIIAAVCFGACLVLIYVVWPLLRWLFWKHWRRTLFVLACFATLIALFYAEEDWRGWHAWNKFKHEWEAKGEHFDFASVVPPPVPDDQNFAMTPVVASSYLYILDKNGHRINPQKMNVVNQLGMTIYGDDWKNWPTNHGYWAKGTKTDLNVWQRYYRLVATKTNLFPVPAQPQSPAEDVLMALSKYDSVIEELRAASRQPCSRFPLNYDNESPAAILLPHLATLQKCRQTLQLRSIAELQNGQPEKALADVKLALQLTDKIRTEPFLISHLVRIAMVQLMLQPVWEGLAEHKWSDAQLAELDSELAKLDFLAAYRLGMHGEMGCQGGEMDRLRRHPEEMRGLSGMSAGEEGGMNPLLPDKFAARLIPAGWFYQNQFRCARMMVEYYIPAADVNQGTVSPTLARRGDAALMAEIKTVSPFNVLEKLMLPALGNAVKKFAYAQASVDLARVAIALERYRLAHGEFPESLDALAPQFVEKIPHDVIGGQPLHYRRDPSSPGSGAASGQFVLYSIGWNETDDGGEVAFKKDGSVDISQGDWVWRYPQKN